MNAPIVANDPGLTLPLSGVHLIEASAGTGKTFTLATLVLRLLLERGVPLPQVLAVTFTRAATAELRERLRRRLRLAERLIEIDADGTAATDDGEALATTQVIARARAMTDDATVRLRLSAALLQLDEAAVLTIHGFCHRALRELGFRSGTLADAELVDSADDVWREVADDLWRRASHDDDARWPLLTSAWKTPGALARDLPKLCDPARIQYPAAGESQAAAALHAIRIDATTRFETMMATRAQRTQDQLIERVWHASNDPAFAQALAERWPVLLVDEFQDTDPRQWDIFRRVHAAAGAQGCLLLIGDPKQAIYRFRGGDLATYLQARVFAQQHGSVVTLDVNFRSRPAVLRAIQTVFDASPAPFIDERIAFHAVAAGGKAGDDDLRVDGRAPAALTVHWLPPGEDKSGTRNKDPEFAMMRAAAVAAIAELLAHGRMHDGDDTRPLRASEIAVLTHTNDQARDMQIALARAGIGAATLSNASVFASDAAADLRRVLESLVAPSDPARFRAALATRLLGFDATALAALDDDEPASHALALRFEQAADTWRRRGPLPALLPFITDSAPRWLRERDGARRLTDALHLAELLQAQSPQRHGLADQLIWFARQCSVPAQAESQSLRLESDAELVQITTVHKSKGLEYPVVVMPFAAYRSGGGNSGLRVDDFHDAHGQPARAWSCKGVLEPDDATAIDKEAAREDAAEAQRQWYVGMTRAKYALHVVWSRNRNTEGTALHWLLHAGAPTGRIKDTLDHAGMQARIEQLAADSADSIVMRPFDPAAPRPQVATQSTAHSLAGARQPRRALRGGAWLHSFSALHARQNEHVILRGADDEAVLPANDDDAAALGGTGFGNAVHDVLEAVDAAAWSLRAADSHTAGTLPQAQRDLVEQALSRHGLPVNAASVAQTTRLVTRALNATLPGPARLCALPASQRVAEMEFHFRLQPMRVGTLFELLQQHGYPRQTPAAHPHATLEGLMHGYIDLVYRADGRYYVVDYKTNRLPAYDPAALRSAVAQHDYDLQYLIYLVALQRWLRFKRGAAFDPQREIGGAVYLFLRGINLDDGAGDGRSGVHIDRPAQGLLDALDALFDGVAA